VKEEQEATEAKEAKEAGSEAGSGFVEGRKIWKHKIELNHPQER
jgi:hypothetical protein